MSYVVAVSIHTLRTEAACSLRLHLQMIGHFNSRTHVWGRFLPQRHFYGDFDSRTRAGCDERCFRSVPHRQGFDSRTRVRCNSNLATGSFRFAHPRRVRCVIRTTIFHHSSHFDSHTRVGATTCVLQVSLACFDSRTRAGCDVAAGKCDYLGNPFRFAHPCRVRPCSGLLYSPKFYFDSRTRAGCDSIYRATRQLKAQHVCFDNTILLLDCINTSQDKCEETSAFRFTVPSHSELRW